MEPASRRLQALLDGPDLLLMPCCFDALSARLVEQAGFPLTFMSGFAVSASRLPQEDRFLSFPGSAGSTDLPLFDALCALVAELALDSPRAGAAPDDRELEQVLRNVGPAILLL